MPWDPPPSAQNIPIRPLTRGVDRSVPPQLVPAGGFVTAENLMVTRRGLTRRDGFALPAPIDPFPYPVYDIADYYIADGSHVVAAITGGTLHQYNPGGTITEIAYELTSGTSLVVSGTGVTCAAATWLDDGIKHLDIVRVSGYEARVDVVISDTAITLMSADIPNATYSAFSIVMAAESYPLVLPSWGAFDSYGLIADGKHPLMAWNGALGTLEYWIDDPGKFPPSVTELIPAIVLTADDRVWIANTWDDVDGQQRQRIRWSALADPRDFSSSTSYIDLPYAGGTAVQLKMLGPLLVAYFSNGIYVGTLTNFPLLPRRFSQIETGGIGLVGPKAVTAWNNTHFFVGQDNIYALEPTGQLTAIGTPIVSDVVARCGNCQYVYAVTDTANSQLVFGFPNLDTSIAELWFYNLVTKAWSSAIVSTTFLGAVSNAQRGTWATETRTWDELIGTGITWISDQGQEGVYKLAIANNLRIYLATADVTEDFGTTPISMVIETGDIDFDVPDEIKVVVRLNLRILHLVDSADDVEFSVEGSTNQGQRWKRLGTLRVPAGTNEGAVVFAQTGSEHRFRLTCASETPAFAITELGLRVRGGGSELSFGTQNG